MATIFQQFCGPWGKHFGSIITKIDQTSQFFSLSFSCISATLIPNYQNYVKLTSFSLFPFLYFNNTNTEFYISPHLTKKICTVHIKLINSNFNNIQPKDSPSWPGSKPLCLSIFQFFKMLKFLNIFYILKHCFYAPKNKCKSMRGSKLCRIQLKVQLDFILFFNDSIVIIMEMKDLNLDSHYVGYIIEVQDF